MVGGGVMLPTAAGVPAISEKESPAAPKTGAVLVRRFRQLVTLVCGTILSSSFWWHQEWPKRTLKSITSQVKDRAGQRTPHGTPAPARNVSDMTLWIYLIHLSDFGCPKFFELPYNVGLWQLVRQVRSIAQTAGTLQGRAHGIRCNRC
jgi:hypothetical protein